MAKHAILIFQISEYKMKIKNLKWNPSTKKIEHQFVLINVDQIVAIVEMNGNKEDWYYGYWKVHTTTNLCFIVDFDDATKIFE